MQLDGTILHLLNDQITRERFANVSYLALAAWCDLAGYDGSAARFAADADEEYSHAKRIIAYTRERSSPTLQALEAPDQQFATLSECYTAALRLEYTVSAALQELITAARAVTDEPTARLIGALLDDQVATERELQTTLLTLSQLSLGETRLWDQELHEG